MMQRSKSVIFTASVALATFNRHAGIMLSTVLLVGNVGAAELGDVTVHSFIGQPLVADIKLTALTPDEATGLQVRLASPDVYRAANARIHPALTSLRMAVIQDGQRQFVHISTRQAIDADYLHLFLELRAGGRHSVRAVTVWLSANPAPVALPVIPVAPVAPAAPVVRSPAVAATPHAVSDANRISPNARGSLPTPQFDAVAEPKSKARVGPKSALQAVSTSVLEGERARALELERQARDSAALGIENEALRLKIAALEEKVAALQQRYAANPVPAIAPTVPPPLSVAVPAPAPAKAGLVSWIAFATLLMLLIGSGALLLLSRKKIFASRHWAFLTKRFKRKPSASTEPSDAGQG